MQGAYAQLEKLGKIGPYDAQGNRKPGYQAEYPKWITLPGGKKLIVQSQTEELRTLAEAPGGDDKLDPLVEERNALAKQVADLQGQLAALELAPKVEPLPVKTVGGVQTTSVTPVKDPDPVGAGAAKSDAKTPVKK